jgi:AcrR family transcriptional regulator
MSKETKKEKIIKASKKLFVDNGFSGTSIRDIAKLSGVQTSLIYHHFDNKLALWSEVKASFLGNKDHEIADQIEKIETLESLIDVFISYRLTFCVNNPDGAKMFDWQRLELKNEDKTALVSSATLRLWKILREKLHQFQVQGLINVKNSPDQIIAMIFGGIVSPFLNLGGFSLNDDVEFEAYKTLLVNTFVQGLKL